MIRAAFAFFREGLWRADLRNVSWPKRVVLGGTRILVHALQTFGDNLGTMRPAGLTTITLLSLAPLLAVISGVADGLGYSQLLDDFIAENTKELPEGMQNAVAVIQSTVDRTSFRALGIVSTVLLLWTGLTLFVRVEAAMNQTWKTRARRPWFRRLSDFIALIVLFPVLVIAALLGRTLLTSASWMQDLPAWLDVLYKTGLGGVTHAVMWVAMTALFRFMPSVTVRWRWAAVGGIVAGSGWIFAHQIYLSFQIGAARANAIYATLAALPLLIVYLQLVWTIILFGAEISYAGQNLRLLGPGHRLREPNARQRERIGIAMAERACARFAEGRGSTSLARMSSDLDVPREWLDDIARSLRKAGVLEVTRRGERVIPARPLEGLTFDAVLDGIRGGKAGVATDRGVTLAPRTDELYESSNQARHDLLHTPVLLLAGASAADDAAEAHEDARTLLADTAAGTDESEEDEDDER